MKLAALIMSLLSAFFGVISALVMTKGTEGVPWTIQSYKGQSEAEKAFRRNRGRWMSRGLDLLAAAFVFAAASAVCGYLAP